VRSPSHAVNTTTEAGGATVVGLQTSAQPGNNRDFILDYRLAGDRIESGVMLYKGQDENFFLAMVEPPKAPPATAISPRDYIFVVDISGSMHGFPLDTAKGVLRELIGSLRPSDTFNVLLFSGSNRFLNAHSVPASPANIEQAVRTIDKQGGGGSTELIPALKRVYAEPKAADVSRTVVVVTDGYVTVEREAFELVRNNLSKANVFSFGIGSSVNRHLMEGLARAGMGEPFIITKPAEAAEQAARFRKMIDSPVLTNVKLRFEGMDVYDVEPRNLPDLLAQRPVMVFGKWRGEAKGKLVLEGQSANGPVQQRLDIRANQGTDTVALRHLWARHRIASLSDQESLEGGSSLRQSHYRAGPAIQPAHAVHQLPGRGPGGAQHGPGGQHHGEPTLAPAPRRGEHRAGCGSAQHARTRHLGRHVGHLIGAGHAGHPPPPRPQPPLHKLAICLHVCCRCRALCALASPSTPRPNGAGWPCWPWRCGPPGGGWASAWWMVRTTRWVYWLWRPWARCCGSIACACGRHPGSVFR
jgi:hypothetical protein